MSHATVLVAVDGRESEIETLVSEQMEPFNENGEFFREGSRWDWFVIGGRYKGRLLGKDIIQRRELTVEALEEQQRQRAEEAWRAYQAETHEVMRSFYDFAPDETLDSLTAKYVQRKLTACAFLRERRWYEGKRMGWFGCKTKSECALEGREEGKCIVGDVRNPPCIIGFGEDDEKWAAKFWQRFVVNLPPETWLVMVDYHV